MNLVQVMSKKVSSGVGQCHAEQATLGLSCPMVVGFTVYVVLQVTRFASQVSDGWVWVGGETPPHRNMQVRRFRAGGGNKHLLDGR